MSGAPMTDRDLARVLAARVPDAAPAGLRARIAVEVEVTRQDRRLPLAVAPLFDADPIARRRSLLLAAALLLTALVAVSAVVGALLQRRDEPLAIDPHKDPAGFLVQSYRGLASLPAFSMAAHEQDGPTRRFYSDGEGRLRVEDVGQGRTRIVTLDRVVLLTVDADRQPVALDLGPSDTIPGQLLAQDSGLQPFCEDPLGGPTCLQMACDQTAVYAGSGEALGRPVHRVTCGVGEYWIDVETGIPLRHATNPPSEPQAPLESGQTPPPVAVASLWEVLELDLGPQPAELFSVVPPAGYEVILGSDPACERVGECREMADPATTPFPTPAPQAGAGTSDADDTAASVLGRYAALPAMHLVVDTWSQLEGMDVPAAPPHRHEYWHDGRGSYRLLLGDETGTVYIHTGSHLWHSSSLDGREVWRDNFGAFADHDPATDIRLGFPAACPLGWQYRGRASVRGRETDHLACGNADFWVDRDQLIVVRAETAPTDPLSRATSYAEVVEMAVEAQPPELFRLPDGAEVEPKPSAEP